MQPRAIPVLLVAVLASTPQLSAATPLFDRTPDGRFETHCRYASPGTGGPEELCEVSFYKLIATPEKFDGRRVALRAFLIDLNGEPTLFPSRESYDSGADVEGITLIGATLPPEVEASIKTGVWPVIVIGTFDARFMGHRSPRLGSVNVIRIAVGPRVNGARPNGPGGF
jgi:hypothetical protein